MKLRLPAAMGSLLKLCKPFFFTHFSSLPNSPATTHLRTYHWRAIVKPKKRHGSFCSGFPRSSRPLASREFSSEHGGDGADGPAPAADLWLFNTMSRKKEAFRPKVEGKVGMYVCGVTAYDLSHIGHARVYVIFDVSYRYLKNLEYEVCYVRNFTDVDDKILDNGCAYQIDEDVYFSVDKFPEYGQLSGLKREDNRAGERVAVDSRKKNPADFALWKTLYDCENVISQHAVQQDNIPPDALDCITKFKNEFVASMSDDLRTAVILVALSDPLRNINDLLDTHKGRKQQLRMESLAAPEMMFMMLCSIQKLLLLLSCHKYYRRIAIFFAA